MDYYEVKKSGQIPAFGNWEYVNDLPITEYFECARQAGLIPPTSSDSSDSSCQCAPCVKARLGGCAADVYGNAAAAAVKSEYRKAPPPPRVAGGVPPKKQASKVSSSNNNNRSNSRPKQVKEQEKQVVRKANNEVKEQNLRMQQEKERRVINFVKPVDEDLYKIPPHLLHTSKRKKMLGFFSRCLVPPCRA